MVHVITVGMVVFIRHVIIKNIKNRHRGTNYNSLKKHSWYA